MAEDKRLIIDIAPDLFDELEKNARERGITVPELLRRAVALDRFIWEHRYQELLVRDGDDLQELKLSEVGAD